MPTTPPVAKTSPLARATPYRTPATGVTLQFNGFWLGDLTDLRINFGEAEPFELITLNASLRGTGSATVPLSRFMVGKVRPGTVTATGIGQWYDKGDVGKYGTLYIGCVGIPNKGFNAFLASAELAGKVNDVWRMTATWQLTDFG